MNLAAEVLFYPITSGRLAWPEAHAQGAFLNAQLTLVAIPERVECQRIQALSYRDSNRKPEFLESDRNLDFVYFLPERQRLQTRAQMADAITRIKPGGLFLLAQANNEGANSSESDLRELLGATHPVFVESKNKCRVIWAEITQFDTTLAQQWIDAGAPQWVEDLQMISQPGLFAWDRIDRGSYLLADQIDSDYAGHAADFGAGYGFLSRALLQTAPGITRLDAYEADYRGVQVCQRNFADFPHANAHWIDLSVGIEDRDLDLVICNPPFHQGHADQTNLGLAFIESAAKALRKGGKLLLVANQHLPYETRLKALFEHGETLAVQDGFKVIEAIK